MILHFPCSGLYHLMGKLSDLFLDASFGVDLWILLLWICIWLFLSCITAPSGGLIC